MFIENEVNLHNLDVEIFTFNSYITYYNDIFKLMLQNPNFIHNVRNLNLYINGNSIVRNKSEYKLIKYHILQITDLHQNLKRISLSYNNFTLYQSLLLSKDYNCSNTLNTIIFYRIDFKGIVNLNKIFEQLNALESVHIIYCSSLNTGFIQQIISLTKPFKLRSLFLNERSQIDESLLLLLQESGGYLENFECKFGHNYSLSFKQQILGSIMKYCKNIKFLYSCEFENTIMYLMLEFIESMKQNLNYLTFSVFNDDIFSNNNNFEWNSTIIMNLGQVLPSKLEYLNLRLRIKTSDFEVFLKNSQDTFINKLLINNIEGQDILLYIKEYIMKKRRVKYLAIMDYFKNTPGNTNNVIYDSKQLFFLEDEVEEFRLYDIKVQDYYSMVVKAYDFKVRN
ncbi:hypothetical protein GLOIN_2v1881853 [Rhizophagus clarus]|nr:hypothetical protein GLOIN_2v1881853 [Rhizophagus clarus]